MVSTHGKKRLFVECYLKLNCMTFYLLHYRQCYKPLHESNRLDGPRIVQPVAAVLQSHKALIKMDPTKHLFINATKTSHAKYILVFSILSISLRCCAHKKEYDSWKLFFLLRSIYQLFHTIIFHELLIVQLALYRDKQSIFLNIKYQTKGYHSF